MGTDLDTVMQVNLTRIFGERDPSRRIAALGELYIEDAILFEPDKAVTGHQAISAAVDAIQAAVPPHFVFAPLGGAVGDHGLARLNWRFGSPDGPAAVTGMDVAEVDSGRIRALYVFLDPAPRDD